MSKQYECVYTRAKCHHLGTKCSECPITDLISVEFDECLDLAYQQGKADAIDEFAKLIHRDLHQLNHHNVDFIAEQLKEKK